MVGFTSVSHSLFKTVSVNNLKLSNDIYLKAIFHTNYALKLRRIMSIISFVCSIYSKVKQVSGVKGF